eukprot:3318357-Alexandrium_andersonii.AAC.1
MPRVDRTWNVQNENESERPEPLIMHGFPSPQPDPQLAFREQAFRARVPTHHFHSPSEAQLGYAQSLERRTGVKMTARELQEKWACSEYIDRWKPGGSGKVEAQQRSVSSVMTQTERTYHRHYKTPRDGDLPAGQHGAWRS